MNSLTCISGHGFRGGVVKLPPSAISSVIAASATDVSIVFTWSGGLAQDGNTVTNSYTLNGSNATPSSSGTGTATFSGLTPSTAYNFVVTAINGGGSKTGSVSTSTPVISPSAITLVDVASATTTSVVFTWSGGAQQDGNNNITRTYTLNGSNATPSSSGTGTATFTGLSTVTVYTFVVTATNAGGSKTGTKKVSTTGLVYNFPFLNDILDYHTGSGVSVGGGLGGDIYWQSTGGYNGGGCLYCSTNAPGRRFWFPNAPLVFCKNLGFSVSMWFKGINGYSDAMFSVSDNTYRYNLQYHTGNSCIYFDDGQNSGMIGYTITENVWYHICMVYLPGTNTNYMYFNGGSANGGATVSMGTTTAKNMVCGMGAVFDDNWGTEQAKGYMNRVNIFNYAISQAEITSLWQA